MSIFKKMTATDHTYAALCAIQHHSNIIHEHSPVSAVAFDDALIDLLADLMHFVGDDQRFDQHITTAKLHYWAEKGV